MQKGVAGRAHQETGTYRGGEYFVLTSKIPNMLTIRRHNSLQIRDMTKESPDSIVCAAKLSCSPELWCILMV
jgi:hypothetical protein